MIGKKRIYIVDYANADGNELVNQIVNILEEGVSSDIIKFNSLIGCSFIVVRGDEEYTFTNADRNDLQNLKAGDHIIFI